MESVERRNEAVFRIRERVLVAKSSHTLEIFQFVNILLLSLITGAFWGTWLGLSRSMTSLSPQAFVEIGHAMIGNLGMTMAVLMAAAMLATLPVLNLLYRTQVKAFYVTLAGFLFFVVALLITFLQVPLDLQFAQWTVDTLPANWQQLRNRWEWFHFLRSWVALFGLALVIAGALFWRKRRTF